MKKTIRCIAAVFGFLLGAGSVGGLETDNMNIIPATILCLTGILIFALAAVPDDQPKRRYREFDNRNVIQKHSADELAERRKARESWESIKEAQK